MEVKKGLVDSTDLRDTETSVDHLDTRSLGNVYSSRGWEVTFSDGEWEQELLNGEDKEYAASQEEPNPSFFPSFLPLNLRGLPVPKGSICHPVTRPEKFSV